MLETKSDSSVSTTASTSVELLDDIKEDLVSPSSFTSSKPSFSEGGPTCFRPSSLHDLPRPFSCPAAAKSRSTSFSVPPASPWSRSRDSGMPLSGSCPSVCDGLLAVVEGLRAELQEKDETIHTLQESYVALLETCACLKNTLDQARLCTACAARRKPKGLKAVGAAPEVLQPQHAVSDELEISTSRSHDADSPVPADRLSSDTEEHSSHASSVCLDVAPLYPSLSVNFLEEISHQKESMFIKTVADINGKTETQDSSRNILFKDERLQELLLCCLEAIHMTTHAMLQRLEMVRSSLVTLSQ